MAEPIFDAVTRERLREALETAALTFLASQEGKLYYFGTPRAIGYAVVACYTNGDVELGTALISLGLLQDQEQRAEAAALLIKLVVDLNAPTNT